VEHERTDHLQGEEQDERRHDWGRSEASAEESGQPVDAGGKKRGQERWSWRQREEEQDGQGEESKGSEVVVKPAGQADCREYCCIQ
jgi:hypothetical protein